MNVYTYVHIHIYTYIHAHIYLHIYNTHIQYDQVVNKTHPCAMQHSDTSVVKCYFTTHM